jgi:hypothetical protein
MFISPTTAAAVGRIGHEPDITRKVILILDAETFIKKTEIIDY